MISHESVNDWVEIASYESLPPVPLVTVVMLVYNHAPFLRDAVLSIVTQETDFLFEILIGEDCSTDQSRTLLEGLQRLHPALIRILEPKHNVGMTRNAEKLIFASRGEYMAFCEGDDYWSDPLKLQRQVDFLIENSDYAAVHTRFRNTIYKFSKWWLSPESDLPRSSSIPSGDVFKSLLRGNFIQTCTFCSRSVLAKAAFCSPLQFASYPVVDWPLFLYISAQGKIAYMDVSTAVYRRTPGSAMNSGIARDLEISRSYLPMLEEIFRLFDVGTRDRLIAVSSLHCSILSQALIGGNQSLFAESWSWLEENDPASIRVPRRRLMPVLMRNEILREFLTGWLKIKALVRELWHYRKQGSNAAVADSNGK